MIIFPFYFLVKKFDNFGSKKHKEDKKKYDNLDKEYEIDSNLKNFPSIAFEKLGKLYLNHTAYNKSRFK